MAKVRIHWILVSGWLLLGTSATASAQCGASGCRDGQCTAALGGSCTPRAVYGYVETRWTRWPSGRPGEQSLEGNIPRSAPPEKGDELRIRADRQDRITNSSSPTGDLPSPPSNGTPPATPRATAPETGIVPSSPPMDFTPTPPTDILGPPGGRQLDATPPLETPTFSNPGGTAPTPGPTSPADDIIPPPSPTIPPTAEPFDLFEGLGLLPSGPASEPMGGSHLDDPIRSVAKSNGSSVRRSTDGPTPLELARVPRPATRTTAPRATSMARQRVTSTPSTPRRPLAIQLASGNEPIEVRSNPLRLRSMRPDSEGGRAAAQAGPDIADGPSDGDPQATVQYEAPPHEPAPLEPRQFRASRPQSPILPPGNKRNNPLRS